MSPNDNPDIATSGELSPWGKVLGPFYSVEGAARRMDIAPEELDVEEFITIQSGDGETVLPSFQFDIQGNLIEGGSHIEPHRLVLDFWQRYARPYVQDTDDAYMAAQYFVIRPNGKPSIVDELTNPNLSDARRQELEANVDYHFNERWRQ